jgi:hypothetical protein
MPSTMEADIFTKKLFDIYDKTRQEVVAQVSKSWVH